MQYESLYGVEVMSQLYCLDQRGNMNGMVDVHSHILPGLDDGPENMEEAVEMCAIACADGITTMVATPHMLNGIYEVERREILAAVDQLNKACRAQELEIEILPGADIHVDKDLPQLLEENKLMTVGDAGQHLMLELPEETVPAQLADLLFELQLAGVTPVISHPERNFEIQQDIGILRGLVEAGNLTQITAGALTGQFGSIVRECSMEIVKAGLAHLVASDAHDTRRRKPELSGGRKILEQLIGEEQAEQMTCSRGRLMIEGKYVSVPEVAPTRKKGLFSFLAKGKTAAGG